MKTDKKSTGVPEMVKDIMKTIEEKNEQTIKLMHIIHFYESFKFQLKLIIKHGSDYDERIQEKANFLKHMCDEAENRAEESTETTLYALYQDQNFINKEGIAKPVPRTANIKPTERNKIN